MSDIFNILGVSFNGVRGEVIMVENRELRSRLEVDVDVAPL
jgi:hypothetical protein